MQSILGKDGWDFKYLDFATGQYENAFLLTPTSFGGLSDLNGCTINPVDSKIYCLAEVTATKKAYLVRIDDTPNLEFVSEVPTVSSSGTCDHADNFFFAIRGEGKLFRLNKVSEMDGYSTPTSVTAKWENTFSTIQTYNKFQDMIAITTAFNGGGGTKDYIIGISETWATIFEVGASGEPKLFSRELTGREGGLGSAGAAWYYGGRVFWSTNDAYGVYELDLTSVDLTLGSTAKVSVDRVGSSAETFFNDGQCPSPHFLP